MSSYDRVPIILENKKERSDQSNTYDLSRVIIQVSKREYYQRIDYVTAFR